MFQYHEYDSLIENDKNSDQPPLPVKEDLPNKMDDNISGITMSVCSSLMKHSCIPNVGRLNKDGKTIFYSLKPLKKGDQVITLLFDQKNF